MRTQRDPLRVRCEAEGSTQHEIEKKQQDRGRKHAKILAAMLVFALRMQPQGYRIQTVR